MLKKFKQKGQVLAFFALILPTLIMFVGAAADLGWYYFNVSRLQNAADAAVLAGAQALVREGNAFENYYVVSLSSNDLPSDFDDYKDVYANTFDSSASDAGELRNYWRTNAAVFQSTLKAGRGLAEEYARRNLADSEAVNASFNNVYAASATDNWNSSPDDADKKVTGNIELKYKIVDGKNDVYGPLYYVVKLQENIRHFMLPGWFAPMDATVKAVVLLRPHYKGLIQPMQELERTKVIDNWEYTKQYKGTPGFYSGKWNHYQAGIRGNNNYGIRYAAGNLYRNESVIVTPERKEKDKNVISNADGSSGEATDANGGKWYSENEVDSINIDTRAEIIGKFTSDWDLGYDFPEAGHSYKFMEGWSTSNGADKRILLNVEFEQAFETRYTSKQADPLWVRIESDPIKNPYTGAGVNNFNSVRQITLNFNRDNSTLDESKRHYKYRPYVIFYTGPENIDNKTDSNGVLIRHSQPVVLNLNKNLNAIIYMPESPVIINGKGNQFRGFIIAKCYLRAVTSEDMLSPNAIWLWDGFNAKTKFRGGFRELTDGYGNTVYVKDANLQTLAGIRSENSGYKEITDDASGTISFYEEFEVPETPVLSFTKDIYTGCTTLAQYLVATANYIHSTYTRANYAKFAGIDESEVSMIKFPDETDPYYHKFGNFTDITIPVATADLRDSDPDPNAAAKDDQYVKVMLGTTEKYIDKTKLPHLRIKRNDVYPYVCIYDLKTGLGTKRKAIDTGDKYASVKPTDDSITAPSGQNDNSAVVFLNNDNDEYKDTWLIDKTLLEQKYYTQYKADKLEFSIREGVRYFMFKADIVAPQFISKYRKVNVSADEVRYVKEGEKLYYMKVDNNPSYHDANDNPINYIIVDENGNILTKPLTAPEVFDAKTETENNSLKSKAERIFGLHSEAPLREYWNDYTRDPKDPDEIPGDKGDVNSDGKYVGLSEYRVSEDYRIPALERVYYKSVFNLHDDSCYSYFAIPELWRVNYTYLNVDEVNQTGTWKIDDMFFTTERAHWID